MINGMHVMIVGCTGGAGMAHGTGTQRENMLRLRSGTDFMMMKSAGGAGMVHRAYTRTMPRRSFGTHVIIAVRAGGTRRALSTASLK